MIQDAAAHAAKPVTGLSQTGQIIHKGAAGVQVHVPAFIGIQRQKIIRVEQGKLAGADFLKIIAGQRQRKFRH